MGCERISFNQSSSMSKDCILDIVRKIDQMQKEAVLEKMCEGCESPLFTRMFNTKPVTFFLSNGTAFEARLPEGGQRTDLFRIEDIKGDCVTLRLIRPQGQELKCTDFTVTLRIDCVCAIQCFPPICCEKCNKRCGEH